MKRILAVIILLLAPMTLLADSIYDLAGDTLPAGKVQIEYNEKFFEYGTIQAVAGEPYGTNITNVITNELFTNTSAATISNTGMYQDFVLKLGLPGGYGLTADFDYIYQNLGDIYNYNNVQSIGFIFSKGAANSLGVLAGMRFPMKLNIAYDPRLITPFTSPSIVAGLYSKGSFDVLNYNVQAAFEQPLVPDAVVQPSLPDFVQGGQGNLNVSGSLGYNIYGNKATQSIELAVETQFLMQEYTGYESVALRVVPEAKVYFYNDFYFILGVEKLLYTTNTFLNDPNTVIYLVKVNYMINSDNRIIAAPAGNSRNGYSSYGVSPTASSIPGQSMPWQVTATATVTH
ncbi:MAG: hypothetical protein ABSA34_02105 [Candidatus Goldiibacteriota bacterium]